jgi:phosphoglycolate phosphatase
VRTVRDPPTPAKVPRVVHLFFDLDGTLTDSRPGILASLRYALGALGIEAPPDAELLRFIGPPTHDAFPELLGSSDPALVERAIGYYRDRYSTVGLFESAVYPGVTDGLAVLAAAGVRSWVVTSKPRVYAETIIEHFGLTAYFVKVYGSELSGERGDKGDLIAYVLGAQGQGVRLRPDETWMIGDRKHDVLGARRNGVHAAGVLWGYGAREELTAAGAERLFASMGEIVSAFAGRPP